MRSPSTLWLAASIGSLWLFAVLPARAAGTFYVDGTSPSCSDAGPGSEAQPYCTVSAAVAAHQGSGTTIYVKPGIYREQVTITASGTDDDPFVLRALGGPVVVDGSDDLSSASNWVPYSGDVYLAASVTWSPVQVFMDGARLVASTAAPGSLPNESFRWMPGEGLYVNAGGGSPAAHQLLVGRRPYGFFAAARSYLTIDGFTVTRAEARCMQFNNACTHIILSRNIVNFAFRFGIQAVGGAAFLIDSNVVSDNNDHGIMCLSGVTASTIQNNESFRNARPTERAANGIHLFGCPGNWIQGNRTHDNQDSGLHLGPGSNNCVSIQNRSWNNGDHGFDQLYATGVSHVGDVAFHNFKDGFSIEGQAMSGSVFDCIAIENGLTTNEFDLWVDDSSSVGFVSDRNIFWNSTSQKPIKFGTTLYSTVAAFSVATGHDAHSIQADPAFMNPWAGDFQLVAGSPAIDAADSGVPNWPATDAEGNARLDVPATPNTGAGPVPYADRGALEFLNAQFVVRPDASLTVTPSQGTDPLTVTADASASSDPDGIIVSYRFDFGDGTFEGPQGTPTATHTYAAGDWIATVVVTDDDGAARSASLPVVVAPSTSGNLVANPSFEQNLDGWSAFGACTLSRLPGGYDGDYALQMSATGTTPESFGVNDHPDWVRNVLAAGINYRFAAWVRSESHTGMAVIAVKEYLIATGQLVGSAISGGVTLSPQWQMIILDYLTTSPGTTLDFQVRDYPLVPGEVFLTDSISILVVPPVASAGDRAGPITGAPRVYPSPFRSTATLRFATSEPGRLRVDIFDLAGRRVRRVLDETAAPAGVHLLNMGRGNGASAERFDPGIYFYRIDAREGVRTGRFIVLR